MFTGIVERTLTVREVSGSMDGVRLVLEVPSSSVLPPWRPVELGESLSIDGACLSAVAFRNTPEGTGSSVAFDVVPETLHKTTLGGLKVARRVNVERSLRVGDAFGGHYVTGHVDGTGVVTAQDREGDQILYSISCAPQLLRFVIPKGSIAVDGISLTVIDVLRERGCFRFAAIPHTLERTCLGERHVGSPVNLETDAFGKWVLHALEGSGSAKGESGLVMDSLFETGDVGDNPGEA